MITAYLETLSTALAFDPVLARRVREEVEDHLRQAVAADPSNDRIGAEHRAIAGFGDAQVLAAQFAMISVAEQMRKLGVALVLVIAGVLVAMKGRVAWYAVTGGDPGHDTNQLTQIVGSVDRYSFWLSVVAGIATFARMVRRPPPKLIDARFRKQLRCVLVLCVAATVPLILSVISDGVLTALRLLSADVSAGSLVPIGTMVFEIACAGMLVRHLRIVRLRTISAVSLHDP